MKFCLTLVLSFALSLQALAAVKAEVSPAERRQEIRKMRMQVLNKLYNELPDAESILLAARGYAVFTNKGINVLLVSTARGYGVLRDHRNGADIFMKVFGVGAGMGAGVKNYSSVIIFDTNQALDDFINSGWDFTGQADANLEAGATEAGGEVATTMMPGVRVYHMTDSGVALQALVQGLKFDVDKELN